MWTSITYWGMYLWSDYQQFQFVLIKKDEVVIPIMVVYMLPASRWKNDFFSCVLNVYYIVDWLNSLHCIYCIAKLSHNGPPPPSFSATRFVEPYTWSRSCLPHCQTHESLLHCTFLTQILPFLFSISLGFHFKRKREGKLNKATFPSTHLCAVANYILL